VESPACALLVAAEQVRTQYRSMPVAIIANAAVSVILCFALRGAVSPGSWAAWLCAEYLWVGGCLLLWRAFNRAKPTPSDIARWRNYAIAGCAYNGIAWGIGGIVLYVPGNLSSQVLVGIMLLLLFLAVTTHLAVVIWHTLRNSVEQRRDHRQNGVSPTNARSHRVSLSASEWRERHPARGDGARGVQRRHSGVDCHWRQRSRADPAGSGQRSVHSSTTR